MSPGRILHRNHDGAFSANEFNPGKGQPSRFAPFAGSDGTIVPTLYAATSREAAVHETLFHDIEAKDPAKVIRRSVVDCRTASRVSPKRSLRLASLFTPDLMRWGVTRDQLIDTPKTAYAQTVLWARALHAADPALDGLIWTSRRCDPALCLLLFGDRLAAADLDVLDCLAVRHDAALVTEIHDFARRAGITIIT